MHSKHESCVAWVVLSDIPPIAAYKTTDFFICIPSNLSSGRDSARLLGEFCWQKNWGATREKIAQRSRNSRRARGGKVGAEGMVTKGPSVPSPETKYKRSNRAFAVICIALTLARHCTKLLELSAQFLIVSPGTLSSGFSSVQSHLFLSPIGARTLFGSQNQFFLCPVMGGWLGWVFETQERKKGGKGRQDSPC